jgi:hypothetical protein
MFIVSSSSAVLQKHSISTMILTGAGAVNLGMFVVTGTVYIYKLYGEVTSTLTGTIQTPYLVLDDSSTSIELTDSNGVDPGISAAGIGSFLGKVAPNTSSIAYASSATGTEEETTSAGIGVFEEFVVGKKLGASTNIQLRYTGQGSSGGTILWHAHWIPLSTDGALTGN